MYSQYQTIELLAILQTHATSTVATTTGCIFNINFMGLILNKLKSIIGDAGPKVDSKHSVESTYSLGSLYSPFYHCHCFSLHIAASGYKPHPVPCVAAQKKAKQRFSALQTLQLRPIYLVQ